MDLTAYHTSRTFPRRIEERGGVPGSFSIEGRSGGGGGKNRREISSSSLTQYSPYLRHLDGRFFFIWQKRD